MYMVVYLDNILIYLNNLEDYRKYVEEVLRHLRTYQLYAFPAKYAFHKESIEFLGFILGPEGLAMDKHKVKVIRDWLVPCQLKEVQSFLGFLNFYQQFIHNYSDIVSFLT